MICTKCLSDKPADDNHFCSSKRTKSGLTQPCRDCHKKRMVPINRAKYAANPIKGLLRTYANWDRQRGFDFDLTEAWFRVNISSKSCTYCKTAEGPLGADRIDNSKGHTMANVLPACRICNVVRNNLFSVDEMRVIGAAIASVQAVRLAA